MRKWYHVLCDKCGYEETFYLGQGKEDQETAQAALNDLTSGKNGDAFLSTIKNAGETHLHIERSLYRCRFCGQLQVRLQGWLIMSNAMYCPAYYCDRCGKLMDKVRPYKIKEQLCPEYQAPLHISEQGKWDIAPIPEIKHDPASRA